MGQESNKHVCITPEVFELKNLLESGWPTSLMSLHMSGIPLCLDLDSLTDDELRAKAIEIGIKVADDVDRDTLLAAVKAKMSAPDKPPWGDDENFDAKRAWTLIQGLRADVNGLKTERNDLAAKVKAHDDATKSEKELADERAADAEARATASTLEAARLRVALKKGLDETQAKRLVGSTEEELEADADELLLSFRNEDDDTDQDPLQRRPRERLRPGGGGSSEVEETDPAKLAALVSRPY